MIEPDDEFKFSVGKSGDDFIQLSADGEKILILGIEDFKTIRFTTNTESTNMVEHSPTNKFWKVLADVAQMVDNIRMHRNAASEYGVPDSCISMSSYEEVHPRGIPKYEARVVSHIIEVLKLNIEVESDMFAGNENMIALFKRAYNEAEIDYPYFLYIDDC